ncbi:MAG: carboxypeptidase regulatory-like domain-containing protein, partial [Ilumatobacteraceae bacterium]|nr:carboxypeptidase regulatory-like domain-containing protein [Ilumatobacteraceae bacterium]
MFRRFTRSIAAVASVATIGLFAIPEVAHAANVDITVSGADGAIARAMVAVLNADGDAIDSVIADSTGKVTIDDTGAASLVVAANGYQTKVVTPVAAGTVTLTVSTKSKLSFSNAYGGQIKPNGLAADGESGVFYATTDAQPSVWRTTDYAGTWAPVPTSADSTEATAAAAGAMPQENANEVFTSAVPGEVAVNTNQSLYFSRTYGNTWTKIDNYNTVTGQNKKHFWVHGGSSGDSSIIFVRTSTGLFAAVVPDSVTDTTPPSFVNVTATLGSFYA